MANLAVFASLEFDPEWREFVVAQLLAHRRRCLDGEPGTLLFEPMISRDEPDRIYLYEVYRDQAAFDTHWNGASIAELHRLTGDKLRIVAGTWGVPIVERN